MKVGVLDAYTQAQTFLVPLAQTRRRPISPFYVLVREIVNVVTVSKIIIK